METNRTATAAKPQIAAARLPISYVDTFLAHTANSASPEIFRKWAAIYSVGAALERRVWVETKNSKTYPNMYVVLVAPPGVGKSAAIEGAEPFLTSLEDHHFGASSLTKAAMIDELKDAVRRFVRPTENPPVIQFNSLALLSSELGVLIPEYDREFMAALTDLWDCQSYKERRRTKDLKIVIEQTQLNMLAACTPAYLMSTLPEGAWDQGFLSRVMLIYSGEIILGDMFSENASQAADSRVLRSRLKEIGHQDFYGKMTFTDEAKQCFSNWYQNGQEPKPEHPKLVNYSTRRPRHLLKLCMIASANESSAKIIERRHVEQALDWLVEAEFFMPDIFKAMKNGGDSKAIEDTWFHVYTIYMKENKKPVREGRIIHFLQERVPAHSILRVLETMVRSGMLVEDNSVGGKTYRPAQPVK